MDTSELRKRLDFDDDALLAECRVETRRVRGPGGQHRNKIETAVRLTHQPSGLTVTASERRSQHENRRRALWRLREAIALTARLPLPEQVRWPPTVQVRDGRLRVSEQNPGYHHAVALVLDALDAHAAHPAPAAGALGLTTSSLVRFLHDHPRLWAAAQRLRERHGLVPLKPPR